MAEGKRQVRLWLAIPILSVGLYSRPGDARLEEVVVTAQHRAENVQDVPITIRTFGSGNLEELTLWNLQDLTRFVSGIELFDDRGFSQPTWVIRGAGLADFNANSSPSAAVYHDDFYLPSNLLGGVSLFDVERIEILSGPQGGLYGRNTTGGVVRVLSNRPQLDKHSAGIRTSLGRWDRVGFTGFLNAPISERVGMRVAGTLDQNGGWQDSLATDGNDEHGNRDVYTGRVQLRVRPGDQMDALVKIETGQDRSESVLGQAIGAYDPQTGDFCDAIRSGRRDNTTCVTWANWTNLALGDSVGRLPSAQASDGSASLSNTVNEVDDNWHSANVHLSGRAGPIGWASISGYMRYEHRQDFDFDGTQSQLGHEDSRTEIDAWSQEFRLWSTAGHSWNWLAGAVYARDTNDEFRTIGFVDNFLIFGGIPSSDRGFDQKTESWSVFGQLETSIGRAWRIHGSLRYTDETKWLRNGFTRLNLPAQPVFVIQNIANRLTLDGRWSGDLGAVWKPTDHTSLYWNVGRSFKSGGFFGGFALSAEELDPYLEESVRSYEIGIKGYWLNQTLQVNAEAFHYLVEDVQGFTTAASEVTGTQLTKLSNLGDARHSGIELVTLWAPDAIDGLLLQADFSWIDAEIYRSDATAFTQTGAVFSFQGLERPFAPDKSASLQAHYERRVSKDLFGAAHLSFTWRDEISPREAFADAVDFALGQHDGYGLLDLRLSLGSAAGRWYVALAATNLTNEAYTVRSTRDDLGSYLHIPGQPIGWQLEYGYSWR